MCRSRLNTLLSSLLCLALLSLLGVPKSMLMLDMSQAETTLTSAEVEACPHHQGASPSDTEANDHHQNSCQNCQLCSALHTVPSVDTSVSPRAAPTLAHSSPNTYQSPDLGRLGRPPNTLLLPVV